jgi:hypothetical protein
LHVSERPAGQSGGLFVLSLVIALRASCSATFRTALAVPERNMGTLFKAVIGFGIAFYVWSPAGFAAHLGTPAVHDLRAQIEDSHPHERLMTQLGALKR